MAFIIGEAGVNHDGKLDKALMLVDYAKDAGCDAVKFQTWLTEDIILKDTDLANYQKNSTTSSQYDLLKSLELNHDAFLKIKQYCDKKNIEFISTPDDVKSLEFLVKDLCVKKVKIGSAELSNIQMLMELAKYEVEIILSTGMGTVGEIETALKILGQSGNNKGITILQCTTEYPCLHSNVNLDSMVMLRDCFGTEVGFSDHTVDEIASVCAIALGAVVLEKHFTYNRLAIGPDHSASLDLDQLKNFVKSVRNAEKVLGSRFKPITKEEMKNSKVVKKKLVAKTDINSGVVFSENNLTAKRANSGVGAEHFSLFLGRVARTSISKDQLIDFGDIA